MVQVDWLVATLRDFLADDGVVAHDLFLRHAGKLGLPQSGMLPPQSAYQILDSVKQNEPGLAATAASTLKVRMMILLQSRRELVLQ